MSRCLTLLFCVIGLLSGCAQPHMPMEPPQKPGPAPEMAKLARFIGTWAGTAEFVEPSPEDMKAATPEGEKMPESFAGGGKMEWALGGMALRGEGWYEMGPDEKVNYVEYWNWDPKAKKYRTWSMSDWGEVGAGWAEFRPDGNSLKYAGAMRDAEGKKIHAKGTMTFVDDNTMTWTYVETGARGKMKMKGESKRSR